LRLLVDAQLPPGLAARLSSAGYQAEHVNLIGLEVATDREIWSRVVETGAVLLTKDEDFVELVRRDQSGAQVVWIRLGNISNQALWTALEPILQDIVDALVSGERLIEIT